MITRRDFLLASVAAALAPRAFGQALPKQITVVVGFPPGGGTDLLARLIAEGMRGPVAPAVIVENKPGAGGRIAAEYVKSAKNDGSVLLFTPAFPMLIYPHVYKNLPYDTLRDFVPVGIGARSMLCFAVGPAVPASVKTLADFTDWAKANPRQALFGAPSGASQHFAGQLYARAAGIPLSHVPYKGGAPAMQDLLGGHLPANVSPVSEALPHHAAGKIRILATTGAKRARQLPDVPTMQELGFREVLFQDWLGMFAPAGTPAPVIARINAAMGETMKSAEGAAALARFGQELEVVSAETFAPVLKADWDRYGAIVQASGFKAEE
jgi:tripartite-type tricarboxylate transporter receptor subunit TctC